MLYQAIPTITSLGVIYRFQGQLYDLSDASQLPNRHRRVIKRPLNLSGMLSSHKAHIGHVYMQFRPTFAERYHVGHLAGCSLLFPGCSLFSTYSVRELCWSAFSADLFLMLSTRQIVKGMFNACIKSSVL